MNQYNSTSNLSVGHILKLYLPDKNDNIKQISVKVFYLITIFSLIFSICFITNTFFKTKSQEDVINESRSIWHTYSESVNYGNADALNEVNSLLLLENTDYKGWITIKNTNIDNPIFQTTNNNFYINNNQKQNKSSYGALHFDYRCKITENDIDRNLIVYGNNINNGSMFGDLEKLRNLNYYKTHSTIEFSTLYESCEYKIFAVFVLNSKKQDDGGYIYNIYRNHFSGSTDFDNWINEARERSVIDADIDVGYEDKILTLVTSCDDFEDARLVVMAREIRNEDNADIIKSKPKANSNPKYPKKWYDTRNKTK